MIGVIINILSVILGGIAGTLFGHKLLSSDFTAKLTSIFGVCAMGMGISSITLMQNMPVVILAVVVGTAIGLAVHMGDWIARGAAQLQKPIAKIVGTGSKLPENEFLSLLVTGIILFCSAGTGIYGCLDAGMTGNSTILISKSILDFFTAIVFACSLGAVVFAIAVPQTVIYLCLFFAAKAIFPLTTPDMVADFKACGGFLLVATGLRMAKIKDFPIADMIPAMVLVMPLSAIWVQYIAPLL